MIRLNVAALIRRGGEMLLIEFDDDSGLHYNLPGGGVDEGETLEEAVRREVREEAGVEVEVGALLLAWEYVPAREQHRYGSTHKVGLIYDCRLLPGSEPQPDYRYDAHQTGVRWKPLSALPELETVSFFGERLLALLHEKGEQ